MARTARVLGGAVALSTHRVEFAVGELQRVVGVEPGADGVRLGVQHVSLSAFARAHVDFEGRASAIMVDEQHEARHGHRRG